MFYKKIILLKSGDGGNGCISFNKFKNKNYSDGGNGGNGGNFYILSNNNFKIPNNNIYISKNGKNGKNNNKTGKSGEDYILKLPIGAYLKINFKNLYIVENNIFIKLIKGGNGGKGNFNFKNYFNSKIATIGKKGIFIFIIINYKFFLNKCYINFINLNLKKNIFNYKNNYISKIYIFYINIIFFKIFFKIIKFYLYFLYIKNLKFNNYWIIINGIEKIKKIKKIKKINLIITPFYIISIIFNIGIKKFFHYLKIWKNS